MAVMNGSDYFEALRKYVNRTDMSELIKVDLLDETVCR